MRIIQIVWIVISVTFLIMVILGLLDTYVSLKYEVEPFEMSGKVSEAVADKRHLLHNLIFTLRCIIVYLIISIVIMFRSLFKD